MGIYKRIRELWKKPKANISELYKQRLIQWRKEPVTVRLERPTRLDRARSLGYRAKQGIFVVRQRVSRGGHTRPQIKKGRRPKHNSQRMALGMNYQWICEQRAAKKYTNCEVLNSYWIAEDGKSLWFEIIMVDKNHPAIKSDKTLSWVTKKPNTGRVYRGLTSAGKKARGLRKKGMGAEKVRPGVRANKGRLK
jgi:large subunit ribosomal protein L15e